MITTLLVDGHVHFHRCFELSEFLDAALSNFRAGGREIGDRDAVGCLLFCESSWSHYVRAFSEGMLERSTEDWTLEPTGEASALLARKGPDARLLLVAGRQIVTAERLEVLALATLDEYADGLPMSEAVDLAISTGAVTVLPWGFGKWTGERGRIVRQLLSSPVADRLCVGDNGGRPALGPEPILFALARERGIPIIPGSDPLPLPAEVGKPGRYGFVVPGPVDPGAVGAALRKLVAARTQPRRYGRLERLTTFVHRQAALRVVGRGGRRAGGTPEWERPWA